MMEGLKEIVLKAGHSTVPAYWLSDEKPIACSTSNFERLVSFAEAIIESYKAELLKEAGEPVAKVEQHARMTSQSTTLDRALRAGTTLYTSDQLAAALLKATGPLEGEVVKWREASRVKHIEAIDWAGEHQAISYQLAAAQKEISGLLTQLREMTEYANKRNDQALDLQDQLAKANQLWQVAQGRCDGLEEKLAKAEQRVAEACALQVATETRFHWLDAARVAKEIRSGEWRKFVKEV